jgi:hypothetical protein
MWLRLARRDQEESCTEKDEREASAHSVDNVLAYGLWSLVIVNSLVFITFAFSFARPQSPRDWRSFGASSAGLRSEDTALCSAFQQTQREFLAPAQ